MTPMNPETEITVPLKTASDEKWILKFVVFVSGFGVTVGLIVLGLALLFTKRTAGSKEVKSQEPQYENDCGTFTLFCFIMAGHLLLVVLMYSCSEMKAQVLLPPKLTVNPSVITDTDSVTLNCQPPPSVSVSQCYFSTVRGGPATSFSCLQTLTGTELLKMSYQSSPAEVEVMCFYTVKLGEKDSPSPYSGTSRITIHGQTPQMTLQHFHGEHVLFTCSLPGSANHDTKCNLYFGEESDPVKTTTIWKKRSSTNQWFCQFIVTIDDLLKRLRLVKQSDASCDYSLGREPNSLSPRSDRYNLTDTVEKESRMTQTVPTFTMTTGTRSHASTPVTPEKQTSGQTPQMTLQHFHGEHVLFTCSLPGSANHDTKCNLYFGEESDPVKTSTIWKKRSSTNQWFCQFIVTIDDLLKRLRLVKQSDASCDYSLGREPNSLSPRSDRYNLTDIVEKESPLTQTVPTFTMTTDFQSSGTRSHASTPVTSKKETSGWPVGTPSITDSLISTFPTSVKPASGTDSSMTPMNPETEITGLSVSTSYTIDSSFSAVPLKTATDEKWMLKFVVFVSGFGVTVGLIVLGLALLCTKRTAGSKEVKSQEPQYDNNDPYHLYNIISEEPAESAPKVMMYSTVQKH
ncbi:uncharacterized protein LOC127372538 isoform X1 [Dicentrarchus labrax]|uniref:uncharacterized protein LOC127372538 isoform X1 n=1 Tax=Dicentrarchus labrax TaxID=13489 RepID=UPI0021F50ACF|nr:uncharacterized protein LOC127372538 isoform X1 [Dicentrarchus labrax]